MVKSPPELWAELSEVEGLERHLGEFGEIRITRAEPETAVVWEGENASGTVELEPTGWGTKVTITAEVAEAEPDGGDAIPHGGEPGPEPQPVVGPQSVGAEPQPVVEPQPVAAEPQPVDAEPQPVDAEPQPVAAEPEPVLVEPDPDPVDPGPDAFDLGPVPVPKRRGFFSRWFSRGRRDHAPAQPAHGLRAFPAKPEPELPTPSAEEVQPQPEPEPDLEPVVEAARPPDDDDFEFDFAIRRGDEPPEAEEAPREPLAPERAKEVLERALENLGQAHHRPFSRG